MSSVNGERMYLSMGTLSCSVTVNGTMDYDADVEDVEGGEAADTGDTGAPSGFGKRAGEDVIGSGEESDMLVASNGALYRVDVTQKEVNQKLEIPGAVAAAERAGQLTVLDRFGELQRLAVDEQGRAQRLWSVALEGTRGNISVRGDDVFVAGDPMHRVDKAGRVHRLDVQAEQVVADASGDLVIENFNALTVLAPDGSVRWTFSEGKVADMGVVPGRDLVFAHLPNRHGENQVVLFDRRTGEVRGEFVQSEAKHVAAAADGHTMAFSTANGVHMYRFAD